MYGHAGSSVYGCAMVLVEVFVEGGPYAQHMCDQLFGHGADSKGTLMEREVVNFVNERDADLK